MGAGRHLATAIFAVGLAALRPASGYADSSAETRALARRVRDLERQNAELLRRLERLERRPDPAAANVAAVPVPVAPAGPQPSATPAPTHAPIVASGHDHSSPQLAAALAKVQGSFQVFADGGFGYRSPSEPETAHSSFALGSLDLFEAVAAAAARRGGEDAVGAPRGATPRPA